MDPFQNDNKIYLGDMKTVTLPIEEYNELLRDQEDKNRLMRELEADAKERGFYVRYITQCWRKNDKYEWAADYEFVQDKNTIEIISKDKVLADAQKEIDRLTEVAQTLVCKNKSLTDAYDKLKNRGFFARLMNKEA